MKTSVLFVCLGNICRSPTAHAVFRQKARQANILVEVESAGTAAYHVGSRPDPRSVKAGEKRDYDFSGIKSQQLKTDDFAHYDYIIAMDNSNYENLLVKCPDEHKSKVQLFLEYSPLYSEHKEVPDPYYGGGAGFELVLDLVEDASEGLLQHILRQQ